MHTHIKSLFQKKVTQLYTFAYYHHLETIFPGFIILFGSNAILIIFIISTVPSPYCSLKYFILPYPTPCSPVHVPPTLHVLHSNKSFTSCTQFKYSSSSSSNKGRMQCKLASPARPKHGPIIFNRCTSCTEDNIISANLDRGTHTSVKNALVAPLHTFMEA